MLDLITEKLKVSLMLQLNNGKNDELDIFDALFVSLEKHSMPNNETDP